MENILSLISDEFALLDNAIKEDLYSDIELIRQISAYIVQSGGKRIRPILFLLCCKLLKYDNSLMYKMAAMIEYIHTATLLHDDVVDESNMRRGRQTANAIFGNAASVLVGDFIYTRAFQMMVSSGSLRVMEVMSDSTNTISAGEVLQLLNIGRFDITQEQYFSVIEAKTAKLFEAAARVSCIIANANKKVEDNLAQYAKYLGIIFQIVDDILDYVGDAAIIGKNIGDDLVEGKVTLPLIFAFELANINEKKLLKAAIEHPKNASIDELIKIIHDTNALNKCYDVIKDNVKNAKLALATFEDSVYKKALLDLVDYAGMRIK